MVKININEFEEYDRDLMREYIELLEETEFEIVLPREISGPTVEDPGWIALEYVHMAYAGELLNDAVKRFTYNVPDPFTKIPVVFHVETEEPEKFADALFKMIRGIVNNGEHLDDHTAFTDAAYAFYEKFCNDGHVPLTIGLMGVAYKLSNDPEQEGDDEDDEEEEDE